MCACGACVCVHAYPVCVCACVDDICVCVHGICVCVCVKCVNVCVYERERCPHSLPSYRAVVLPSLPHVMNIAHINLLPQLTPCPHTPRSKGWPFAKPHSASIPDASAVQS